MYDILRDKLEKQKEPIDIIVNGLGFMGFGFLSSLAYLPNMRIPLVVSRDPIRSKKHLESKGYKVKIENNPSKIKDLAKRGYICLSEDTDLISTYENKLVIEMTGTVPYGTEVALETIKAKKHIITMNPELQATVGSELKILADKNKVQITDVMGDQPGSLSALIARATMMGFRILIAGNMKRYMDRHATQDQMRAWAKDKGLATRQTVSFTDGTKQSIEMTLVANYFGLDVLQFGMKGPQIEKMDEVLNQFPWDSIPREGIADYVIGRNLFPGVFLVVEHKDPHQQQYLRYLGLGEGPRYVLFEPYHLCHLEVASTIAKVALFGKETINNSKRPHTKTIAVAKFDLKKGLMLDGIGGDTVYGNIDHASSAQDYLPVGLAEGAVLKTNLHQDQPIKLSDVELPKNAATILSGLVGPTRHHQFPTIYRSA